MPAVRFTTQTTGPAASARRRPASDVGGDCARLFIGLWPDEPVRAALHAHQQAWTWPPTAQLVRRDRLHLTLHFLGGVPAEQGAALATALREVPVGAFTLRWRRCRVWGGGVAVLEPEPDDALQALHAQIGQVLVRCGFALEDRPYKPHVTLARRAAGALPAPALPDGQWAVSRFALVESVLKPPSRYEVLASYPQVPNAQPQG